MAVAGLLIVVGAIVSYFGAIFALHKFTYRTWVVDVAVVAGCAIAVVGSLSGGAGGEWVAVLAVTLSICWFVMSRMELHLHGSPRLALTRGSKLPSLAMRTVDGALVTDQDLMREAPALLVLYRGWWCPSSKLQLGELLDEYDRLAAAGLTVYAASVDSPEQAAPMQEYVGGRIRILCQIPAEVLESIGARDTRGAPWYDRLLFRAPKRDIAMPTSIIIDTDGRVTAVHRANSVDDRPHPEPLLLEATDLRGQPRDSR